MSRSFIQSCWWITLQVSRTLSTIKDLCQQWKIKLIFRGAYRVTGTGIVERLDIIDVGCNLKQFDGLTSLTLTPVFYDRSTTLQITDTGFANISLEQPHNIHASLCLDVVLYREQGRRVRLDFLMLPSWATRMHQTCCKIRANRCNNIQCNIQWRLAAATRNTVNRNIIRLPNPLSKDVVTLNCHRLFANVNDM